MTEGASALFGADRRKLQPDDDEQMIARNLL